MVIFFLANGFEEIEALAPIDLLRRAGVDVLTVAVKEGGADGRQVMGAHGIPVLADVAEADFVLPDEVDMVVLPGGMPGSSNLDASPLVDATLRAAYDKGSYLAAICAAPLVLGHRGYLDGLQATCYPGFETELGTAEYVSDIRVVRAGRIVTAPGMGCAQQFGLALVELLRGAAEADRIRRSIMTPEA